MNVDRVNTLRLRTEHSQYSFSVLSIFLEAVIKHPVVPAKITPIYKTHFKNYNCFFMY